MRKILLLFMVLSVLFLSGCTASESVFICAPFNATAQINCDDSIFVGQLSFTEEGYLIFEASEPETLNGYTVSVYNENADILYGGVKTDFSYADCQFILSDLLRHITDLDNYSLSLKEDSENVVLDNCTYIIDKNDMKSDRSHVVL